MTRAAGRAAGQLRCRVRLRCGEPGKLVRNCTVPDLRCRQLCARWRRRRCGHRRRRLGWERWWSGFSWMITAEPSSSNKAGPVAAGNGYQDGEELRLRGAIGGGVQIGQVAMVGAGRISQAVRHRVRVEVTGCRREVRGTGAGGVQVNARADRGAVPPPRRTAVRRAGSARA